MEANTDANTGAKPIVVGVDGNEGARAALRWAVTEAQVRRVPLHVVSVARDPTVYAPLGYGAFAVDQQLLVGSDLTQRHQGVAGPAEVGVAGVVDRPGLVHRRLGARHDRADRQRCGREQPAPGDR